MTTDRFGRAPAELRQQFEDIVTGTGEQASAVGDALFSVANLLDSRPSVRRALTDTGRSAEDRQTLARRLVDGRVDQTAAEVLAASVRQRWARPSGLAAAVEEFGVLAHLFAARSGQRLERVEEEVFRFGRIVHGDRALRSALIDRSAPADARRQLVGRLLDGKAAPETVRLVEHAVLDRRDRSLEAELERVGEFAAQLRERRVAVVHVAAALTAAHRDRLERALAARAGGPVLLNVVIEPGLVGGIKVEIGDEVVDGTVTSRLDAARRQLAAGR